MPRFPAKHFASWFAVFAVFVQIPLRSHADDPPLPMPGLFSVEAGGANLKPIAPEPQEKPLAINLATALRLSGAQPVVLAAAEASAEAAAAELSQARSLWLPSVNVGAGWYHHDGATQGQSGNFYINSKDQLLAGGGLKAYVSAADAIFQPLAARQVLRARESDIQTARNDALLATSQAYFDVQRARGRLAGATDIVDKGKALREKVSHLALGQVAPTDINRARALLADFEQVVVSNREAWQTASADLTQTLRLDATATVVPLEPPHMQVTIISPHLTADSLVPIGLTNRPELASQQALVQAALVRVRQERMRPLVPSLVMEGGPGSVGPGGFLMGGVFASGVGGVANPTGARDDISLELVWGLNNLGFGNRAQVRERRAEQQRMSVELLRLQDQVAGDVARAYAQLQSANKRIGLGVNQLRDAEQAYEGSMKELGHVVSVGDAKVVLERTLDVVSSLQSLAKAYDNYYGAVSDYDIAQFRMYHALGYPAYCLANEAGK
jgi:outer membrane protein TolC